MLIATYLTMANLMIQMQDIQTFHALEKDNSKIQGLMKKKYCMV